jgi:hypothetical protein
MSGRVGTSRSVRIASLVQVQAASAAVEALVPVATSEVVSVVAEALEEDVVDSVGASACVVDMEEVVTAVVLAVLADTMRMLERLIRLTRLLTSQAQVENPVRPSTSET